MIVAHFTKRKAQQIIMKVLFDSTRTLTFDTTIFSMLLTLTKYLLIGL